MELMGYGLWVYVSNLNSQIFAHRGIVDCVFGVFAAHDHNVVLSLLTCRLIRGPEGVLERIYFRVSPKAQDSSFLDIPFIR